MKILAPLTTIIILQYSPKKPLFFLFPGGMGGGDMPFDSHDKPDVPAGKNGPGPRQDSVKTLGSTSGSLALG